MCSSALLLACIPHMNFREAYPAFFSLRAKNSPLLFGYQGTLCNEVNHHLHIEKDLLMNADYNKNTMMLPNRQAVLILILVTTFLAGLGSNVSSYSTWWPAGWRDFLILKRQIWILPDKAPQTQGTVQNHHLPNPPILTRPPLPLFSKKSRSMANAAPRINQRIDSDRELSVYSM